MHHFHVKMWSHMSNFVQKSVKRYCLWSSCHFADKTTTNFSSFLQILTHTDAHTHTNSQMQIGCENLGQNASVASYGGHRHRHHRKQRSCLVSATSRENLMSHIGNAMLLDPEKVAAPPPARLYFLFWTRVWRFWTFVFFRFWCLSHVLKEKWCEFDLT